MAEFDVVDGWGSEAQHDYEPTSKEEIGLREGDFICVELQCENGWWIGTNRRSKKRGLFPGSYVELMRPMKIKVAKVKAAKVPEPSPFESPESFFKDMDAAIDRAAAQTQDAASDVWQWGKIARDKAVSVLVGSPQGTFLVRASTSEANAFSISVVQDTQVRHIKILNVRGGFAINTKDKPQPSLADLIKQKMGEKLSSKLQGSNKMKETTLLVKPLPNPSAPKTNKASAPRQSQQQQPPQQSQQQQQSRQQPNSMSQPPSKAPASAKTQYARQRGGTANVAATSQITATDGRYKSRALKEKIKGEPIKPASTTASNVDPFAVAPTTTVDPFAVAPTPTTVDPFAVAVAPTPTTVDPFAVAVTPTPTTVDPFATATAPAPDPSDSEPIFQDPFASETIPVKPPTPEPVVVVEPEPEVVEEEEEEETPSGPVFLDVLNFCYNKCNVDDGGRIDGGQLKPLLMMSKLESDVLGQIWSKVDSEKAGSVDFVQLGYLLGLMGQAQRGETLDIANLGAESIPPTLEGLAL